MAGFGGGGVPGGSVRVGDGGKVDEADGGEVGGEGEVGGGLGAGGDLQVQVDGFFEVGAVGLAGVRLGEAAFCGGAVDGDFGAHDGGGLQVGEAEVQTVAGGMIAVDGGEAVVGGGTHRDLAVGAGGYGDDCGLGWVLREAEGGCEKECDG